MKKILLALLFTMSALFVSGQINDSGVLRLLKARQQLKGLDKQELRLKQDLKLLEKSISSQSSTPKDATTKQKLDSMILHSWSGVAWEKISKDAYTYDAGGRCTTVTSYELDISTNKLANKSKDEYTYNANGKWNVATSFNWDSTTSTWVAEFKQEFTYNSGGYATQIINSEWFSTIDQWLNDTKYDLTYNADNTLKEFLVYSYDVANSTWDKSTKYDYTYTDGVLTQMLASSWDKEGSQWTEAMKYTYEYNAGGKLIREITSISTGTDWMFMMKYEFTYDANNRLSTETTLTWNAITNWVNTAMYEQIYDANGNNTEYYTYKWESSQWVKQTKEVTDFELNSTYADLILPSVYYVSFLPYSSLETSGVLNKPLQDTEYDWNAGASDWSSKSRTIYYYSPGPGTGVVEQKADDASAITIYPNPVTNAFNLNTSEANVQISIFDLSGSLLLSKQMSGSDPVDVSFLSGGVYMAKIVTDKATVTRKFVKR